MSHNGIQLILLLSLIGANARAGDVFKSELDCYRSLISVSRGDDIEAASIDSLVLSGKIGGEDGFFIYSSSGARFCTLPPASHHLSDRSADYLMQITDGDGKAARTAYLTYHKDSKVSKLISASPVPIATTGDIDANGSSASETVIASHYVKPRCRSMLVQEARDRLHAELASRLSTVEEAYRTEKKSFDAVDALASVKPDPANSSRYQEGAASCLAVRELSAQAKKVRDDLASADSSMDAKRTDEQNRGSGSSRAAKRAE